MKYEELEVSLLKKAIDAFQLETGLNVIVEGKNLEHNGQYIDAVIKIEGYEIRYAAEVKNWAQHTNLGVLVNQVKSLPQKGILIADYVNPKMADKLRHMNIPFIDAVGNAYINEKPLYIYIKTNKGKTIRDSNIQGMREAQKRGRAFKPTGLKVLYALLKDKRLVQAPYREIAEVAGVALGTVGWVINDLKQGDYLVEAGKTKKSLRNKKQLIVKWVEEYLEKLRPKQFMGTFTADNDFWRENLVFNAGMYGVKWGGEVAAAKLTGYLKPEKAIIYLLKDEDGYKQLFAEKRMRKNPEGNIQVYKTFWNEKLNNLNTNDDIVDPLIVYADLLATNDVRNLETARMIYDKELIELIRED